MPTSYLPVQGQYQAYICHYTQVYGCSPAEVDLQWYFQVGPATDHRMILKLVKHGWISREAGKWRSLRVLVPDAEVPAPVPFSAEDSQAGEPTHE